MLKKKKTNYVLSFNKKQIYISKIIKIQNMINEYFLDITTSLEKNLPFDSSCIDLNDIDDLYDILIVKYNIHILEKQKSLLHKGV